MYNISSWFAAKTLTVVPVQVVQTSLFCVITYWMVGYNSSASRFFIYLALLNNFQVSSGGSACTGV